MGNSGTEDWLVLLLKNDGFPEFEREYKFLADRRFRADIAFVGQKLLVEVEGGVYVQGRHVRGKGYEDDLEKYNLATLDGWKILRFSTSQIKREPSKVLEMIRHGLEA